MDPDVIVKKYSEDTYVTEISGTDMFSLESAASGDFVSILASNLKQQMNHDVQYTEYNLTPTDTSIVAGKILFEASTGTLAVGRANGLSVIHMDETVQTLVKAGEAVTVGTPLYISSESSGTVVKIAKANDLVKHKIIGFAAESAALNSYFHMNFFGVLRGVDDSLVTGTEEVWRAGNTIWLTAAGKYTNVFPALSADRIECGKVLKVTGNKVILFYIKETKTFYYDDGGGNALYGYSLSLDENGDVVFSYREV